MANEDGNLTFDDLVDENSPPWMQGEFSAGWFGVLFKVVGNTLAQGLAQALRMPWLLDPESPDDVLPLIGAERRMPKYPLESMAQYRRRLHGAWAAYQFAGAVECIEGQLAAAGFPGKVTFFPVREGPFGQPAPYRTQFWIRFPFGTHPITGLGAPWDSFNWDDGTTWGPVGLTPEFLATIRGIVRKWKSVQWICRGFIFELNGARWDEFNWDDGTTWNDEIEVKF